MKRIGRIVVGLALALALAASMMVVATQLARAVVNSTGSQQSYTGNGATTAFSFPYPYFQSSDIVVTLFNTATNMTVTPAPVLNGAGANDYTVTGISAFSAGNNVVEFASATITFNTAPPGNYQINFTRNVPPTQLLNQLDNSKFPASSNNAALDKAVMGLQQVLNAQANTLRYPITDPALNAILPPAAQRANQFAGFDLNGNVIAGLPLQGGLPVQPALQPFVEAPTIAAGRLDLGIAPGTVSVARVLYGPPSSWQAWDPSGTPLTACATSATACFQAAIGTAFPYALATTSAGYDLKIYGGDDPANGGHNFGGGAAMVQLTAALQFPPIQGGKIDIGAISLSGTTNDDVIFDSCEMCSIDFGGAQLSFHNLGGTSYALRFKPTQGTPFDNGIGVGPMRVTGSTLVGRLRYDLSNASAVGIVNTDLRLFEVNLDSLGSGCGVQLDSPGTGQNDGLHHIEITQLHAIGSAGTSFCNGTTSPAGGQFLGNSTFNLGIATDGIAGSENGFDEWGSSDEIHLHLTGFSVSSGYSLKFESGACRNIAFIESDQASPTITDGSGCTGANANRWYLGGVLFIAGVQQNFPASGNLAGTSDTQTLTNKTISGASNTLSAIANAALSNSSMTIGGQAIALGGTTTNQGTGGKLQLSTGATTTNDCVKYDANGNTIDAGAACSGGASITNHGDSNYAILSTDRIVATNAAFTAARVWTLPAASSVSGGQVIAVEDSQGTLTQSNTLSVARNGSDTICGGAGSFVMTTPRAIVALVSDGVSNWMVETASSNLIIFTGNGTYTPNPCLKNVFAQAVGGGGGGGGGARVAAATACSGGGGAGGGGSKSALIPVAVIGSSVAITVGAGGSLGAGATVNGNPGTAGGTGGDTSIGTLLKAFAGGGGQGGASAANSGGGGGGGSESDGSAGSGGSGGSGGSPWGNYANGHAGDGGSGANASPDVFTDLGGGGGGDASGAGGSDGAHAGYSATGGGGGGGVNASNVAQNGGAGSTNAYSLSGTSNGASGGGAGGNGATFTAGFGLGQGSAGGGGNASGAGGAGGTAGIPGGGGGGGGCAQAANGGAGAIGARGEVRFAEVW